MFIIIIIIIIIICIMMARWAGDEIMNNPAIKSHIYMVGSAAPTLDNYDDNDDDDDDDGDYGDYGDEDDTILMMIIYRLYTARNQCHKKSHIYTWRASFTQFAQL